MKQTRFTKTLFYGICSLGIAAIIFLAISYFGKEEPAQKNDSSQNDKKQEQVDKPKDSKENKVDNSNNQSEKQQEEQKVEKKETGSVGNTVTQNENKNLIKDTGEEVLKTPKPQDYKGKKLSDSEGVGTTGKIFKSQKEALDFGRKEVRRLVDEDKKPRQFSISKVTAEDGSMEKVVSNPSTTEENKE